MGGFRNKFVWLDCWFDADVTWALMNPFFKIGCECVELVEEVEEEEDEEEEDADADADEDDDDDELFFFVSKYLCLFKSL